MGEVPEGAVGLVDAFLAPTALLSVDDEVGYSRILRIPETLTCCDLDKVDGRKFSQEQLEMLDAYLGPAHSQPEAQKATEGVSLVCS